MKPWRTSSFLVILDSGWWGREWRAQRPCAYISSIDGRYFYATSTSSQPIHSPIPAWFIEGERIFVHLAKIHISLLIVSRLVAKPESRLLALLYHRSECQQHISLRNLASAAILPTAYVRQLRPPASKQDSLPMPLPRICNVCISKPSLSFIWYLPLRLRWCYRNYNDVIVNGTVHSDIIWRYENPARELTLIAG